MRKTVGILDDVAEYGQRLVTAINTRKGSSLRATFIANPFEMKEKMADQQIQLLLVSERYACELEDASVPVYTLLSDSVHDEAPDPGERGICRYSPVTDIIEMLLSEVNEKRELGKERLLVVFSPDGVDTAVKQAELMAAELSKSGKTLFLPFDNFYGTSGKKSITELLYAGLSSTGRLNELLGTLADEEKTVSYDTFGGPEHFSDLWQYTESQMESLLEALLGMQYRYIVIGAGFMSDAVYRLFKKCDVIYIPTLDSGRSKEMMRQLKASGDENIAEKVREWV